ncbi:MAG: Holliday junction branch migration protein RuvA [Lachnospiraceae bacterium]|jgi:Holliday junction DNA helicase RuvA|nr:Holliday junction branch migration protein RuvA [Lachnospiraceae bacterium]
MITYLRGELISLEEETIIVDVNGIGYNVYMTGESMEKLPRVGQEVLIHTYFSVKEDSMKLFGFLTRDHLSLFKMLIGVNGVGPKGGLAILNTLSLDDLRYAIISGDSKAISKSPGIGKKTAEKIIIELKDKISSEDIFPSGDVSADILSGNPSANASNKTMAIEALEALGISSLESIKAVKSIEITEDMTTEDILKLALKYLG